MIFSQIFTELSIFPLLYGIFPWRRGNMLRVPVFGKFCKVSRNILRATARNDYLWYSMVFNNSSGIYYLQLVDLKEGRLTINSKKFNY